MIVPRTIYGVKATGTSNKGNVLAVISAPQTTISESPTGYAFYVTTSSGMSLVRLTSSSGTSDVYEDDNIRATYFIENSNPWISVLVKNRYNLVSAESHGGFRNLTMITGSDYIKTLAQQTSNEPFSICHRSGSTWYGGTIVIYDGDPR